MNQDQHLPDHWWISGSGTIHILAGSQQFPLTAALGISANSLYQIESMKIEIQSEQVKLLATLEGLSSYRGQISAKIGTQSLYYDGTVPGPLQLVRTSPVGFGLKLPFSGLGMTTSNMLLRRLELSRGVCDSAAPVEVHSLLSTLPFSPPDEKINP